VTEAGHVGFSTTNPLVPRHIRRLQVTSEQVVGAVAEHTTVANELAPDLTNQVSMALGDSNR
jgi:hypothetical protein